MPPLLLALLLNVAALGPVCPASFTGTVVDPSGAAVPNATVRLEASGGAIDEFRTGSDGRFEFKSEAPGPLRVVVTAPGFAEVVAAGV